MPDVWTLIAWPEIGASGLDSLEHWPSDVHGRRIGERHDPNARYEIRAVTGGRPSCYVHGLDHGGGDLYSLVERGLVYDLGGRTSFEPTDVLRFCHRPEWPAVLRRFAEVDRDEAAVTNDVRVALLALASPRSRS